MSRSELPVIAAIPNYNMAKGLKRLLPQIIEQNYNGIYVLDDASTDNSEEVVSSFNGKVKFVRNTVNQGAGGARNLILPLVKDVSLIHFMDADVSLVSKNIPELIRELPIDGQTAYVGGLILESNGKQSHWNYGPRLSITTSVTSIIINLWHSSANFFPNRPHSWSRPSRRQTAWVLERSFVMRSDTLKRLGGFDASIREHDIQPLYFKAEKLGLKTLFDPSFAIISHQDIDVRPYSRKWALTKAEFYVSSKYGRMLHWFFPILAHKKTKK